MNKMPFLHGLTAVLMALWMSSCTGGGASGVRVLGEVRQTGEPVFVLPGNQRFLLVFVRQSGPDSLVIQTVVYGGKAMRRVADDPETGMYSPISVWYLEESELRAADSSDLEFDFLAGESPEAGRDFHTASVLLEGVDQEQPICDWGNSRVEDCPNGSVVFIAAEAGNSEEPQFPGFTRVSETLDNSTGQLELFARYVGVREAAELNPVQSRSSYGNARLTLGVRPSGNPGN